VSDVGRLNLTRKGGPRALTCGCCTGGCVCVSHQHPPRLPAQKCDTHKKERS